MVNDFIKIIFKENKLQELLQSLIVYDPPSNSPALMDSSFLETKVPTIIHFPSSQAGETINSSDYIRSYVYMDQAPGFADPSSPTFNKPAARIAYTRTLKLLRDNLGPKFDLEKVRYIESKSNGRSGRSIAIMSLLLET